MIALCQAFAHVLMPLMNRVPAGVPEVKRCPYIPAHWPQNELQASESIYCFGKTSFCSSQSPSHECSHIVPGYQVKWERPESPGTLLSLQQLDSDAKNKCTDLHCFLLLGKGCVPKKVTEFGGANGHLSPQGGKYMLSEKDNT